MSDVKRIEDFCVDYYNKHEVDKDDEPITTSDIYIMSYTDIGIGWNAFVYVKGYIYELATVDEYGTVLFHKYSKCGGSLYKWEDD